ncbi:uncharacterized protein F5147DRAFT_46083 [Suillus discolor]|uniref:DUF6533 domain-containing protein n=1 Tax=Suillus discolor TaxID=1912936 RepID=A0A9P7FCJ5_9AGAM|nr:uncharacterized protein F5147DRAFT_46083 [Suillus discolor]KAG2113445.1 hypothetical protein F5147DRAFT_46083 [Suillus discolor]
MVTVVSLHKLPTPVPYTEMTLISNDPTWLPFISMSVLLSYFAVVYFTVVVYDWVLTFGQEFELVWKQRWSFMTVLYICVRCMGLSYSVIIVLWNLPFSITDSVGLIVYFLSAWIPIVVNAMLGVIMMIRIYAMYGRPKKMLIFLLVVLLSSTIASGVMTAMGNVGVSAEELVLFGYHACLVEFDTNQKDLNNETMIPTIIWEILAFILAVWVVIKHFNQLRQSRTGSTITGDFFTVLIQSHAFYFAAFAIVACFSLGLLSTYITYSSSVGSAVYIGFFGIGQVLQMFVLGPRLILSIREYHAKLVAMSDEGISMMSIDFQAGGDVEHSHSDQR